MGKTIIYQLLPRYWGNTSGANVRGGSLEKNLSGHFSDIDKASLDYIKWLGCSHVWLTGVARHATGDGDTSVSGMMPDAFAAPREYVKGNAGSPYAVSDWYDVNPYLADVQSRRLEEFRELVARIHQTGLKVITDFIPNHVAPCYVGKKPDGSVENIPLCGWHDYDWTDTVKVNYSDRAAWEAMYNVLHFWASMGVDGFRCDMVELVPGDFLKWVIWKIKCEFPHTVFVAEAYNMEAYSYYAHEVGFDLLYDKSGLYDTLCGIMDGNRSAMDITSNWQRLGDSHSSMLNFLENHDEKRLPHIVGKARNAMCALGVSALFNDAAFMLYQGQEIGEDGMEDAGMSGPDGRSTIYDWWSFDGLKKLWKIIHSGAYKDLSVNSLISVDGISVRDAELFCRYAAVLRIASSEDAFASDAVYDLCFCQDGGFDRNNTFAFLRGGGGKLYLVVANFSHDKIHVNIQLPEFAYAYFGRYSDNPSCLDVVVPACDFVIKEL